MARDGAYSPDEKPLERPLGLWGHGRTILVPLFPRVALASGDGARGAAMGALDCPSQDATDAVNESSFGRPAEGAPKVHIHGTMPNRHGCKYSESSDERVLDSDGSRRT